MQPRYGLILLAVLFLAGCHQNPDDTIRQADKAVTSWSATLDLAGSDLAAGRVTRTDFRQVLTAASEELDQRRKSLNEIPQDHPGRPPLSARLADLQHRVADLQRQQQGGRT